MSRARRALRSETAGKSAWGLVEQVISVASAFLTAILLAGTVGDVSYGAYAGVYALMAPFLAFMQGGMALAVLDQIVRERKDPGRVAAAYMGYTLTIGPIVALVAASFAGRYIHGISVVAATLFIVNELVVMATLGASTTTLQASKGYIFASRVRTATTVWKMIVLVSLSASGKLTVEALAVVQSASFLVLALVIHRWQESVHGAPLRPGRFGKEQLSSIGLYSIGISASGVQNSYDQTVLSSTHKGDAGRYAAAYRIISMGFMPLGAIANATHTDFLDPDTGAQDQFRRARRFAAVGIAYSVCFCTALFIAAPLVPKLLGEKFDGTASIIRWLAPVVPLRGITIFPMNGLLGLGRNGLRTKLLIGGAVLSLVLYFSLIPRHSWKGAVAGSLISEGALFIATWIALYVAQLQARRTAGPVPEPV